MERQDDVRGRLQRNARAPAPPAPGTGGLNHAQSRLLRRFAPRNDTFFVNSLSLRPAGSDPRGSNLDDHGDTIMPAMTMVQALNSAMDVMLARDPNVLIFGEDVGFYGGVFRVTDGLQKKHGEQRVFDAPIAEGGMLAVAVGMGAYGLRPIVEIQFADYIYPGDRPAGLGGGAAALSLGRRVFGADHGARALRRRHLRRPDPQPERRGDFHACLRAEDGDPVQPLRRQGPLDQRHRGRRSGRVLRAKAPLQRPVRRPPRPAVGALDAASAKRGARGLLHRAARPGRDRAAGRGGNDADLRHDGARRTGRRRPKAVSTPR